jgi:hypothetical protein
MQTKGLDRAGSGKKDDRWGEKCPYLEVELANGLHQ